MFGLIVDLITDHIIVFARHQHHLSNDPLRIKTKSRISNVHNLASTIWQTLSLPFNQYIRIFFGQPGWKSISWRPNYYFHAIFIHFIQSINQFTKIKFTIMRLIGAPGAFTNTNHVDPSCLHHFNVLINAIIREIFEIIGNSI